MSYRAGCAQSAITPPLGVSLAGYFHDRRALRVRDDLYARAVVIESHGTTVVLISLDLAHVTSELTGAAKDRIGRDLGIPAENIMICATHTHAGPEVSQGEPVAPLPEYVGELPGRIAQTVAAAADRMFPAVLRPGRAEVDGYSFNRLQRRTDGTELFGSPKAEGVIGSAGHIDPELQTIAIADDEGAMRCMIVNFALHPDVIGGGKADFISADWPGEMAKAVSSVYGRDVVTLFLQATSGDINHVSHSPTSLPTSGERKAVSLGRGIAGAAVYAAEKAEPTVDDDLISRVEVLRIPYYTRDDAMYREMEALRRQESLSYFDSYLVDAFQRWEHDGEIREVPIQVMRIGDVGLVALPAEIFSGIGLEIKRFSPFKSTLIAELANDRVSVYIPTLEQAERGAYGARPIISRRLCADAGKRVSDASIRMLHEIARSQE